MLPSRRQTKRRQAEAIRIAQSSLGLIWLLALAVWIFSGGSAWPFLAAAAFSALPIGGLAYFRYRQHRPRTDESAEGRHHDPSGR